MKVGTALKIMVIGMLFSFGGQAIAETPPLVVANYLSEICQKQGGECSNYLLGVKEGLAFSKNWDVCFLTADTTQLRLAYLLYASTHPQEIAGPAVKMAAQAFVEAFKCP